MTDIGTETPKGIEQEGLKPAHSLRILVHPSFLIGSQPHPLKYDTDHYKDMTKAMQQNAMQRFLPTQEDDVLLIMPHETPTLQSWRDSREAKKEDPDLGNWTDIYKRAKMDHRNNVMLVGDLTQTINENFPEQVEAARKTVDSEFTAMLRSNGFLVDGNTDITIGGEFRDLCVYETMMKLLLLPQVQRVKVDKLSSIDSAHSYGRPFTEESMATSEKMHSEIVMDVLERDFVVGDDAEFIYVEKHSGSGV